MLLSVPPSKVEFVITGREEELGMYTVNQNEKTTFRCLTDSNPPSDMLIRNSKSEQITLVKNTTIVSHTIDKTSCDDAEDYTCSAMNMLAVQQESAVSKVILIVKCKSK